MANTIGTQTKDMDTKKDPASVALVLDPTWVQMANTIGTQTKVTDTRRVVASVALVPGPTWVQMVNMTGTQTKDIRNMMSPGESITKVMMTT